MPKKAPEKTTGPRLARGRFVSRSIATSEQLATVPLLADYLFRACIPFLDVAGRMTGNPALIKSQVVPLRDEIDSRNLPELLRSLSAAVDHEGIPLVVWYEINGMKVLEFPKFSAHQTGLRTDREAPSKFPARNGMEKLLHLDGPTPAEIRSNSGVGPAQDEVEGEWKRKVLTTPPPTRARDDASDPPGSADLETLRSAVQASAGDHFDALDRFVRRRPAHTHAGWWREMGKLIGPGSQFTAEDLANTCDEDEALVRTIESPYVLRTFLGTRHRERTAPPPQFGAGDQRNGAPQNVGPGERSYRAGIAALEDL